MSAEVIKKSKPGPVTSYIDFIVSCRNKMLTCGSDAEFKEWYDKTLLEKNMPDVVDAMFFSIIESEVGFSRSQEGGLEFVSKKLQSLTPESDPLIDLTVPQQDIENFSALNMFYNGLDQAEKNSLIKEMLLVVVMQPGNIYAQQNELALKPPQSVFPRSKGGGFFSSDSAADTPKSGTPLKPRVDPSLITPILLNIKLSADVK